MKFMNKRVSFSVITMLFIAIISCFIPLSKAEVIFNVNYDREIQSIAQMFYDNGSGYTEDASSKAEIVGGVAQISINDDIIQNISKLRLDPVSQCQEDFKIESMGIKYRGRELLSFSSNKLRTYVTEVVNARLDDENLKVVSVQDDSNIYFSSDLMSVINKSLKTQGVYVKLFRTSIVMVITILILFFVQYIIYSNKALEQKVKNIMQKNSLEKSRPVCFIILAISDILIMAIVILHTVKEFLIKNFNGLSFSEIVFHLKVPMEGTSTDMVSEYFKAMSAVLICTVVFLFVINILILKVRKILLNRITYIFIFSVAVVIFLGDGANCLNQMGMIEYLKNQFDSSEFIEENYVNPNKVNLTFPDKKRNLIYIYLESMESTFISKDQGGAMDYNIIPELTEMAHENTNFSEDDMVGGSYAAYGSTWTVGAMVAQTSGLPLLLPIDGNSYGEYSSFLPGAVSLGDILAKEGYNQEIMVGSDINFGGRGLYFSQHGNYKLWDYSTAVNEGKIGSDYYVWWGYEDKKLYEYAKEEITKMAEQTQPFSFTMLTVDTHHIGGFKCELCGDKYGEQYENVLACASTQVYEFVKWIQQQDFYENTTIVISGDHPTMDNVYMEAYYDKSKERRVYNCFINSAVETSNSKGRKFTSMDLFPTTLAVMGVKIQGDKLGLGTNLYSDKQTLAEQYGYEYIDQELAKNSRFYNKNIIGE